MIFIFFLSVGGGLTEWRSKDKWLSFFFVCQAEGEETKSGLRCVALCAEVSGGLIFLTAVRPAEGQRQ